MKIFMFLAILFLHFLILCMLPHWLNQWNLFIYSFGAFSFGIDTLSLITIDDYELKLLESNKWCKHTSCAFFLYFITIQRIQLCFIVLIICVIAWFLIFKFFYRLNWKRSIKKFLLLYIIFYKPFIMSVFILMIRLCIYIYDIEPFLNRFQDPFFKSRQIIKFFSETSEISLILFILYFLCFLFLWFVSAQQRIPTIHNWQPLSIYLLLISILIKIFTSIYILINTLLIFCISDDMYVDNWYNLKINNLNIKNLSVPFFNNKYILFYIGHLFVLLSSIMEIFLWSFLFFSIYKLYKQWLYNYTWLIGTRKYFNPYILENYFFDLKKYFQIEKYTKLRKKKNIKFATQVFFIFFQCLICILFNFFLLAIADDISFTIDYNINHNTNEKYLISLVFNWTNWEMLKDQIYILINFFQIIEKNVDNNLIWCYSIFASIPFNELSIFKDEEYTISFIQIFKDNFNLF